MNPEQRELVKKVDRADNIIKLSALVIVVCILALQLVLFFSNLSLQKQLTDSVAQNASNGLANHKRTQALVVCVAETLYIPIDQRSKSALDDCTKDATNIPAVGK